jgi:hypothetical protein
MIEPSSCLRIRGQIRRRSTAAKSLIKRPEARFKPGVQIGEFG